MRKTLIALILLLSFFWLVSTLSNTFDGDLGWHLRFGKDAFAGNFQYLDSYTWGFFGQPWTNHEWGGDLLFWFLYNNFGYFALVLTASAAVFTAIFLIQKIWQKETTIISSSILLISAASVSFALSTRLSMFGPMFLAILLWSLEKIPHKKTYWLWPIILWFWSAIHGSWILGFIVINIYLFGNIAHLLLKKYCLKYAGQDTGWTYRLIIKLLGMEILSGLVILINPYGIKMWQEILRYFSEGYYKQFITEWIPSYTYPIYPIPLILGAVCSVFVIWGLIKKKASLAQTLLFLAIFYSAFQYKRNNLYLVIVCAPILTVVARTIMDELRMVVLWPKKICAVILLLATVGGLGFFSSKINFGKDIFTNQKILTTYGFPYDAVNALKKEVKNKKIHLFNEFYWGGYLNWTMPDSVVYLDGRGTATWKYDDHETMLARYQKIRFEAGGLAELENSPAEYVILQINTLGYPPPNFINKIIFTPNDFQKIFSTEQSQLEKMLDKSKKWKVIYEDTSSKVWEKT